MKLIQIILLIAVGLFFIACAVVYTKHSGGTAPNPHILIYPGSIIILALIVALLTGDKEKSRKIGSGIVMWGGFIATAIIWGKSTNFGAMALACFLTTFSSVMIIYHIYNKNHADAKKPPARPEAQT